MIMNPDIREAHVLKGWYDREGHQKDFTGYKSEGGAGAAGTFNPYPIGLLSIFFSIKLRLFSYP